MTLSRSLRFAKRTLPFFITLFFLLNLGPTSSHKARGQERTLGGVVKDSTTGAPIPFVNIAVTGTQVGSVSDTNGTFNIRIPKEGRKLKFSCLGYKNKVLPIPREEDKKLTVELTPTDYELQGIEITPTDEENPAHPIIRKVLKKKDKNRKSAISEYKYESYNKVNIGMKVREKFRKSWYMKPFRFVFENIDSSGTRPYLPLFVSETFSEVYYRKKPRGKKEYILATNASGVENPTVTKYLGNMYSRIDIYKDNVVLFGKTFASPISNHGFSFYDYYLLDSTRSDGITKYRIHFRPKRKSELTFKGEMMIDGQDYALERLDANISSTANINYINDLNIQQVFRRPDEEHWMLVKDVWDIEATIITPHNARRQYFYARKTTSFKDFKIDKTLPDSVFRGTDDISNARKTEDTTESYWEQVRHEKLTENEKAVFSITDSIKKMPHYKVVKSLAKGYAEVGPIEIGPFFGLYSFNSIEGSRFRFGGRTKAPFDEKMTLDGYIAYGMKDERYKYGGSAKYFFSRDPWSFVGVAAQKDLEQLGTSNFIFSNDNILTSVLRRNPANKLNGIEQYRLFFNKEWPMGFSNTIQLQRRTISPLGKLEYKRITEEGTKNIDQITTSEVSLFAHFGFREKYYTTPYRRFSLGSNYPLININFVHGFKGVFGGNYDYDRLIASIDHNVRLGYLGYFNYRIEAGKYWGQLPYPLLELHDGNETFFLNETAFNTMNYYEFVSDEYVSLGLTHHFEGLFFNRIPLLRRLKLREVVSGKAVIGRLKDQNRSEMELLDDMYTLDRPFIEASIGVENILSFIRVDALWRLSYLDHPNISRFGVRGTVHFGF